MDTPIDYGEDEINDFIPKNANAKYLEIKGDFPEIVKIEEKLYEVLEKPIDSQPLKEVIEKKKSIYQISELDKKLKVISFEDWN